MSSSSAAYMLAVFAWPELAASQALPKPISVDVSVVNVLCTVRDRHGLVSNLSKANFQLSENGKPQTIRYFASQADLPLTVVLLLDVSGSVDKFVNAEKETAAKFFEKVLRPSDQAAVIGFAGSVTMWQTFTSSLDQLKSAVAKVVPVAGPGIFGIRRLGVGTLLYDAVFVVASSELGDLPGAKVMVIVSDGLDNGSQMRLSAAVKAAQVGNTVVYSICHGDTRPLNAASGCDSLKSISEPTGGRMLRVSKKLSLDGVFDGIRDELRSQYLLGYLPSNPLRNGGFRRLQVNTIPKPFAVRARRGYFAYPPDN